MTGGFRSRSKSGDKAPGAKQYGKNGAPQAGKAHRGRGQRGPAQGGRGAQRQRNRANRDNRNVGAQGAAVGKSLVHAAIDQGVDPARAVAFDVVRRVSEEDAFANLVLPKALRKQKLSGRDAAFATEITYGTLRTLGVLDAVIAQCSTRELDAISPVVIDALRLGTYQVLYTRVEAHAAVDTAVRLVVAGGEERAKGFANGILRTIARTPPNEWLKRLAPEGEIAGLAFRHAHPTWIAQSFARVLDPAELSAALAADSERPTVHLVARPGEISAEELALITGNEEGTYSPYAVYMDSGDPGQLEPVQRKMAAVQDEGSQLIARAVCEVPVNGTDQGRWLDLCAGPGGKAALMGALARIESAHVDAVEVSPHRAQLIEKTVQGLPVTVHVADGRNPQIGSGFDRILVDAPCSGLGALRRRPEARWRKSESDIAELSILQFELVSSALQLVRPGGVVVYSTCSPDLRETRAIVDRAVEELGAQELDAREFIPDMGNVGKEKSVQMWPHRHGTDAMFMAVLRRGDEEGR